MKYDTSVSLFYRRYNAGSYVGCPVVLKYNTSTLNSILASINGGYGQVNVTSIVIANNIATVVTSSDHYFNIGQVVTIAGSSSTELNSDWKIMHVVNSTTFLFYTEVTGPITGTITVKVKGIGALTATVISGQECDFVFADEPKYALNVNDQYTYCLLTIKNLVESTQSSPVYLPKVDAGNPTNIEYTIVANRKMIYFISHLVSGQYQQGFFAGIFDSFLPNDAHNFVLFGGQGTYQDYSIGMLGSNSNGYIGKSYTQSGTFVSAKMTSFGNSSSPGSGPTSSTHNSWFPMYVWEGTTALRGKLPGIYDHSATGATKHGTLLHSKKGLLFNGGIGTHAFDILGPW